MTKVNIGGPGVVDRVKFKYLADGDYFLDEDGDLCVKLSERRFVFLQYNNQNTVTEGFGISDPEEFKVIFVHTVTITYNI